MAVSDADIELIRLQGLRGDKMAAALADSLDRAKAATTEVSSSQQKVTESAFEFDQAQSRLRQLEALNGDFALSLMGAATENIDASLLNASAVGTFKSVLSVQLKSAAGALHEWANFTPTVTVADTIAGPSTPVVVGTPKFANGSLSVQVTFDTDGGVTKTYIAGETVTVTIKVSAADTLLGYTVAAVTKTFTVV